MPLALYGLLCELVRVPANDGCDVIGEGTENAIGLQCNILVHEGNDDIRLAILDQAIGLCVDGRDGGGGGDSLDSGGADERGKLICDGTDETDFYAVDLLDIGGGQAPESHPQRWHQGACTLRACHR